MKKVFILMSVALVAMFGLSSCNSDDQDEAMVLSGEWRGDWKMWYEDDFGHRFYAENTSLKLVPDHRYSTRGYGIQVDSYSHGEYRYLWYKFDWEVRNGIIYIDYRYDDELDTFIRDYRLDNNYFSGYFGNSSTRFRMAKISDWYYNTPEIMVESDAYGWSLWSAHSKQFEQGAVAKANNQELPKIVKRGSKFTDPE